MRKTVKVDELIRVARYELESANRYRNAGDNETADFITKRVDGMLSLITICSIKDNENWYNEWNAIYDRIYGNN